VVKLLKREIMRFITIIFFSIILIGSASSRASDFPYELTPQRELVILGGITLFTGTSYYANRNIEPPSRTDVEKLDRNDINRFDRSATNNWSPKARKASDIVLRAALITPAAAAVPLASDGKAKEILFVTVMFGESIFLITGMTGTAKGTVRRNRPYLYNTSLTYEEKKEMGSDSRKSFFSGHSSASFCAASFATTVYADIRPDSPLKYIVGSVAFSLAAATGYLRYRAGMHYPSDIIAGAAAGTLTGYIIPAVHRKNTTITVIPFIGKERGIAVIFRY
jgi:membrane-associated phospholipid phosphatase